MDLAVNFSSNVGPSRTFVPQGNVEFHDFSNTNPDIDFASINVPQYRNVPQVFNALQGNNVPTLSIKEINIHLNHLDKKNVKLMHLLE